MAEPTMEKPVVVYPRDAVLELDQLAVALRTIPERVSKMDLPCFYVSKRRKEGVRFIYGQVLDHLAKEAAKEIAA